MENGSLERVITPAPHVDPFAAHRAVACQRGVAEMAVEQPNILWITSEDNGAEWWDASSAKAHYKNRPVGSPFFAIFNLYASHESSLFPAKINPRYQNGLDQKSKGTRIRPEDVIFTPYLPDLPQIRDTTLQSLRKGRSNDDYVADLIGSALKGY